MTDRPSSVASITLSGVLWSCFVTDNGGRYEWRSPGGRGKAGRNIGLGSYWASSDNRVIGNAFATLRSAMAAAVAARISKRAA